MSAFAGIDRSVHPKSFAGVKRNAPPITMALIQEGFRHMIEVANRPPPPPWPMHISDDVGVIIWSRYRAEVDRLRAQGLPAEELGHRLAMTTLLTHEMAVGFALWLERVELRAKVHGRVTLVEAAIGSGLISDKTVTVTSSVQGAFSKDHRVDLAELMQHAADEERALRARVKLQRTSKPAPPVPPWARERRRR